jgi:hypothetical protein
MRKLGLLFLCPALVSASDDDLHMLSLGYSQHDETLSFRTVDKTLSPDTFNLGYAYFSETGYILRADIWTEESRGRFRNGAQVEKEAWGGGISLAYVFEDVDVELAYSYSHPEIDAWMPSISRSSEQSESKEYSLGVSTFLECFSEHDEAWSFLQSLQLGYQQTDSIESGQVNDSSASTSSNQSGWFLSSALNVSYLYEMSRQASLSPFVNVSWTSFIQGEGLTRTTAFLRNISRSSTETSDIDTDGSGVASIGVGLSVDRYHFDISVDETLDLPSIGTQINLGLGVVW